MVLRFKFWGSRFNVLEFSFEIQGIGAFLPRFEHPKHLTGQTEICKTSIRA